MTYKEVGKLKQISPNTCNLSPVKYHKEHIMKKLLSSFSHRLQKKHHNYPEIWVGIRPISIKELFDAGLSSILSNFTEERIPFSSRSLNIFLAVHKK